MVEGSWLSRWADERQLASVETFERYLKNARQFDELVEAAALAEHVSLSEVDPLGDYANPVIASSGIDLSGRLACNHHACLEEQVDKLFRKVWHYFDGVVVTGPDAHRFRSGVHYDKNKAIEYVTHQFYVHRYVREIGAEPWLAYRPKVPLCKTHADRHAAELGLLFAVEGRHEDVIKRLLDESEVEIATDSDTGKSWYSLHHDRFAIPMGSRVEVYEARPNDQTKALVVADIVDRLIAYVASDVETARALNAPLMAEASALSLSTTRGVDEASTALSLELPVLEGISTAELLRIISEERLSFERFRSALREAIRESVANSQNADPVQTARSIQNDVLEPALNEIQQRLIVAERLAARKTGLDVVLGTVTATVGALLGMPLMIGTGVAAAASSLRHTHKFMEEQAEVQLSEMYFLWQLEVAPG